MALDSSNKRAFVVKELEWIIQNYIPIHLNSACQCACSEVDSISMSSSLFPSATLVLSTVGTDVLKGFVTLDGPKISKAEIQLLLPSWNKGYPISVHLDPDYPTELPQILTCSVLVDLIAEQVVMAHYSKQALDVEFYLSEAIKYCKEAISVLENSDGVYPMVPSVLKSAPDGLVLSFGVQNSKIVAAAYISATDTLNLQAIQSTSAALVRSTSKGSIGASISQPPLTPTLNASPESLVRVDSVIPALTAAHEMLVYCISNLSGLHAQLRKLLNMSLHCNP